METMHAVVARSGPATGADGAFADEEAERPTPLGGDLLVRVEAVSVNPVDVKLREGGDPGGPPRILGFDAAGTVAEVGEDAEGFAVGDRVFYAGDVRRPGSDADYQAVDHRIVGHLPDDVSFADAAALPLTMITAWEALFDRFRMDPTSFGTLLVVGGAGGVGSAAIQLARGLTAARILATGGRAESREWAVRMGAHATVDRHDLVAGVRAAEPDGVDYLFSMFSEGRAADYAAIVNPFGAITAIDDAAVDVAPLKPKSISWHWEYMFTRTSQDTSDVADQGRILEAVAELLREGIVTTTATTAIPDFSASGIGSAHRLVAAGSTIGKVVVHR